MKPDIAIWCEQPVFAEKSTALATTLQLPVVTQITEQDFLLQYTAQGLQLLQQQPRLTLIIDFLAGKQAYRYQQRKHRKELLVRACGGNAVNTSVFDATAGLGRDAFVLASYGYTVTLCEQSAIIAALLQDGLDRLQQQLPSMHVLQLLQHDSVQLMQQWPYEPPSVVYLDPMFPARNKAALVKKEMQILQNLLQEPVVSDELLCAALALATQRVVVKRARLAPPLNGRQPDIVYEGSSSRFDVYLRIPK